MDYINNIGLGELIAFAIGFLIAYLYKKKVYKDELYKSILNMKNEIDDIITNKNADTINLGEKLLKLEDAIQDIKDAAQDEKDQKDMTVSKDNTNEPNNSYKPRKTTKKKGDKER